MDYEIEEKEAETLGERAEQLRKEYEASQKLLTAHLTAGKPRKIHWSPFQAWKGDDLSMQVAREFSSNVDKSDSHEIEIPKRHQESFVTLIAQMSEKANLYSDLAMPADKTRKEFVLDLRSQPFEKQVNQLALSYFMALELYNSLYLNLRQNPDSSEISVIHLMNYQDSTLKEHTKNGYDKTADSLMKKLNNHIPGKTFNDLTLNELPGIEDVCSTEADYYKKRASFIFNQTKRLHSFMKWVETRIEKPESEWSESDRKEIATQTYALSLFVHLLRKYKPIPNLQEKHYPIPKDQLSKEDREILVMKNGINYYRLKQQAKLDGLKAQRDFIRLKSPSGVPQSLNTEINKIEKGISFSQKKNLKKISDQHFVDLWEAVEKSTVSYKDNIATLYLLPSRVQDLFNGITLYHKPKNFNFRDYVDLMSEKFSKPLFAYDQITKNQPLWSNFSEDELTEKELLFFYLKPSKDRDGERGLGDTIYIVDPNLSAPGKFLAKRVVEETTSMIGERYMMPFGSGEGNSKSNLNRCLDGIYSRNFPKIRHKITPQILRNLQAAEIKKIFAGKFGGGTSKSKLSTASAMRHCSRKTQSYYGNADVSKGRGISILSVANERNADFDTQPIPENIKNHTHNESISG